MHAISSPTPNPSRTYSEMDLCKIPKNDFSQLFCCCSLFSSLIRSHPLSKFTGMHGSHFCPTLVGNGMKAKDKRLHIWQMLNRGRKVYNRYQYLLQWALANINYARCTPTQSDTYMIYSIWHGGAISHLWKWQINAHHTFYKLWKFARITATPSNVRVYT